MTENQNGFKIVLSIIPVVYFYIWPLTLINDNLIPFMIFHANDYIHNIQDFGCNF